MISKIRHDSGAHVQSRQIESLSLENALLWEKGEVLFWQTFILFQSWNSIHVPHHIWYLKFLMKECSTVSLNEAILDTLTTEAAAGKMRQVTHITCSKLLHSIYPPLLEAREQTDIIKSVLHKDHFCSFISSEALQAAAFCISTILSPQLQVQFRQQSYKECEGLFKRQK